MTPIPGSPPVLGGDPMRVAAEQGRVCALVAKSQRDLAERVAAYPDLFPPRPFDPALLGNIAMSIAFNAPWCDATQLRVANRTVLWVFAVDWLVDYVAKSREEVDELTTSCLTVADGAVPDADDSLGRFLAELREEQARNPAFVVHRPVWRQELNRWLAAMAREWDWKQAADAGLPTLDEYLDNAANFASTLVNVAHWVHTGDSSTLARLGALVEASDIVQRILRLINDLATYDRDRSWGDLNALLLTDRAVIERRIVDLVAHARELLVSLENSCPVQADYLARQIGFSSGFYRSTDFWGTL